MWLSYVYVIFATALMVFVSFLLSKINKRSLKPIKSIIKMMTFILVFTVYFMAGLNSGELFSFSVAVIGTTYICKYVGLLFKKLDFGMNSDYRTVMLMFLLVSLYGYMIGSNVPGLNADRNEAMNAIWITILVDQIINQMIVNWNESKEDEKASGKAKIK